MRSTLLGKAALRAPHLFPFLNPPVVLLVVKGQVTPHFLELIAPEKAVAEM